MDWHCRYSSIGMPEKQVAASRPYDHKAKFFEQTYEFPAF